MYEHNCITQYTLGSSVRSLWNMKHTANITKSCFNMWNATQIWIKLNRTLLNFSQHHLVCCSFVNTPTAACIGVCPQANSERILAQFCVACWNWYITLVLQRSLCKTFLEFVIPFYCYQYIIKYWTKLFYLYRLFSCLSVIPLHIASQF
jgi:hypothetical protein